MADATSMLELLTNEYRARSEQKDNAYRLVIQIAGFSFTTYTAIIAYILTRSTDEVVESIVYWLLPLTFIIPYAVCIQLIFVMIFLGYYLRTLEDEIREITELEFFQYHWAETRALWSIETGSWAFKGSFLVIFLIAAGLYAALTLFSFNGLNELIGFEGMTTFVAVQVALILLMTWVMISSQTRVRDQYERWIQADQETYRPDPFGALLARYAVLPRPFDLATKGSLTVGSIFAIGWLTEIPLSQRTLLFAIATLTVVELLAKQATYIWNDIRDHAEDRTHPHKKHRPLARLESPDKGKPLFFVRVILACLACAFVSVTFWTLWLILVVTIVFAWQALYHAVERGSPIARLLVAAGGYAIRAGTAALIVMVPAGTANTPIAFLWAIVMVVFALTFLGSYWRAEHPYLADTMASERGSWFLGQGHYVTLVANLLLAPLLGLVFWSAQESHAASLIVGAGVGVALTYLVYASLGAAKGWPRAGRSSVEVSRISKTAKRRVLTAFFVLATAGCLLLPSDLRLAGLTATVSPLVSAVYAGATFEELNLVWLSSLPNIPGIVDRWLFDPGKTVPHDADSRGS